MYIPKQYQLNEQASILAFMRRYPFATMVTAAAGTPVATHLPFHLKESGEAQVLTAHMARANPQWQAMDEVLLIFQGPHAYISPKHYEKEENVPTWNYIAVHAYGKATLITDEERGYAILEELMQQSEPKYLAQWERLSPDYKRRLYRGIVPFEITITELQAKHKLSQNKTETEQQHISAALAVAGDSAAADIARYMQAGDQHP